jgi:sugar phosphate permease
MIPEKKPDASRFSNVFFGWWTVIATGLMAGWGSGVWSYGFSSYFKPMQQEFGWTRAQVSAAHSLGKLEGGVEGPFGGYFTDKYGPRAVNMAGELMAGFGLIMMHFTKTYWQFLLFWGFLTSVGFNLAGFGPLETAISNWFVRKRGLAIGSGRFIFAAVTGGVLPFMGFLLYSLGWRQAFLLAGLMTWVIGLPLSWFFVKPKRPEFYGLLPDGTRQGDTKSASNDDSWSVVEAGVEYAKQLGEIEFTVRQLLRTRGFWIMTVTSILYQVSWSVVQVHQVPYLMDMGLDPVAAAGALGLMVLISAPGRLIGGILSDRVTSNKLKYLFVAINTAQVAEIFIFMNATNLTMIYLFVLSYGLTMGVRYVLYPLTRGRFFGRKAFASIQGISALMTLPASIVSPIYAGWIFDVTGSYSIVLTQGIVLLAIGSIAFFFMDQPRPPERITGVTEFF